MGSSHSAELLQNVHALCENLRELIPTLSTRVVESRGGGVLFLGRKGPKHSLPDASQTWFSCQATAQCITTVERTHVPKKEYRSRLSSFREAVWLQSKGTDKSKLLLIRAP